MYVIYKYMYCDNYDNLFMLSAREKGDKTIVSQNNMFYAIEGTVLSQMK